MITSRPIPISVSRQRAALTCAGADPDGVVTQLREKLRLNAAAVQLPIGLSGDHTGVVDLIEEKVIIAIINTRMNAQVPIRLDGDHLGEI